MQILQEFRHIHKKQAFHLLYYSEAKEEIAKHGMILKYSRPIFKYYISPAVGAMKYKRKIREKYNLNESPLAHIVFLF